MARGFLTDLKLIEREVILNGSYRNEAGTFETYSEEIKDSVLRLISFVEHHPFTKSVNTAFICEHWRLSAEQLADLWNSSLKAKKPKAVRTFHAQVVAISSNLRDLFMSCFDGNISTLSEVYIGRQIEKINLINSVISSLWDSNTNSEYFFDSLFSDVAIRYCDMVDVDLEDYNVEDCGTELRVLKALKVSNLESLLDNTDVTKLAYLRKVMNKPLKNNNTINIDKVKVLRVLNMTGGTVPISVREEKNPASQGGTSNIINTDLKSSDNVTKNSVSESSVTNTVTTNNTTDTKNSVIDSSATNSENFSTIPLSRVVEILKEHADKNIEEPENYNVEKAMNFINAVRAILFNEDLLLQELKGIKSKTVVGLLKYFGIDY